MYPLPPSLDGEKKINTNSFNYSPPSEDGGNGYMYHKVYSSEIFYSKLKAQKPTPQ